MRVQVWIVAAVITGSAFASPRLAVAQVVSGTVAVEGKQVRTQKFTLACTFPAPADLEVAGPPRVLSADQLWATLDREYTIHLIDRTALPSGSFNEYSRQPWHGYFEWSSQKWDDFMAVDENRFVLVRTDSVPLVTYCTSGNCPLGVVGSKAKESYAENVRISLIGYERWIDRTTLDMNISYVDKRCSWTVWVDTYNDYFSGCSWSDMKSVREYWKPKFPLVGVPRSSFDLPSDGKCTMAPYRKPPERLGF